MEQLATELEHSTDDFSGAPDASELNVNSHLRLCILLFQFH